MIKSLSAASLLILAQGMIENGPYEDRLLTKGGSILCRDPSRLEEAVKALDDAAWMEEIGCLVAKKGFKATKISPSRLPTNEPLQVRIRPDGASGITLWGRDWAFTFENGEAIPQP